MSEGGGENPWAWLGLLKWSLAYTDGTVDGQPPPMSEEDKAFLENVMKEGIIDENERMKTILKEVTTVMTKWKEEQKWDETEEGNVNELLQELRDIVEQIDFARSFAAMKGLDFSLGCVQERTVIPQSTRTLCLGLLATLSNNNPPVQKQLLELGALKTLSELFFVEQDKGKQDDPNGKLRARIIQAIGAIVRSHEMGEAIFNQLNQSPDLIMTGLGMGEKEYIDTPQMLRQRSLFLFRALVTSDYITTAQPTTAVEIMKPFRPAIRWVAKFPIDDTVEKSSEIREMALAMLQRILEQGPLITMLFGGDSSESNNQVNKDSLVALGVRRVAALRVLTGEDREMTEVELEHWEAILVLLARTEPVAPPTSKSSDDKQETPKLLLKA